MRHVFKIYLKYNIFTIKNLLGCRRYIEYNMHIMHVNSIMVPNIKLTYASRVIHIDW